MTQNFKPSTQPDVQDPEAEAEIQTGNWVELALALHGVAGNAGDAKLIASYAAGHLAAWRLVYSFPLAKRSEAARMYEASQ